MERQLTSISDAKDIFGRDFIGYDEILSISPKSQLIPKCFRISPVPYSPKELKEFKENGYCLILGFSTSINEEKINLKLMRSIWGSNPLISEPCFYDQDWYVNETFYSEKTVSDRWYLINKFLIPESKGKSILPALDGNSNPSACECAYAFFLYYFYNQVALWPNEYVWCVDKDVNGDQIYVGRYFDFNGLNKNGFSIHRHLSLKNYYGSIKFI